MKIKPVEDAAFTSGSAGGKVTGLKAVKANRYAGGIAGSVVTADAIGVLNQTLGVGQFIPFELSQVSVEGTNWTVTATEKYAAGACGLMLGGTADGVTINNIQNITAGNYTGGFAGRTGLFKPCFSRRTGRSWTGKTEERTVSGKWYTGNHQELSNNWRSQRTDHSFQWEQQF